MKTNQIATLIVGALLLGVPALAQEKSPSLETQRPAQDQVVLTTSTLITSAQIPQPQSAPPRGESRVENRPKAKKGVDRKRPEQPLLQIKGF